MDIVIRRMREADCEGLFQLWRDAGLPFKPTGRDSAERLAKEMLTSSAQFFVAEIDGTLIGSILGTHDGRKGWINRVAVLPSWRRQGIAERLIRTVEEQFTVLGIEIFTCLIEADNIGSQACFVELGYRHLPDIYYFSKRMRDDI